MTTAQQERSDLSLGSRLGNALHAGDVAPYQHPVDLAPGPTATDFAARRESVHVASTLVNKPVEHLRLGLLRVVESRELPQDQKLARLAEMGGGVFPRTFYDLFNAHVDASGIDEARDALNRTKIGAAAYHETLSPSPSEAVTEEFKRIADGFESETDIPKVSNPDQQKPEATQSPTDSPASEHLKPLNKRSEVAMHRRPRTNKVMAFIGKVLTPRSRRPAAYKPKHRA